jgi:hypothetical protein
MRNATLFFLLAATLLCSCKPVGEEPRWIGLAESQMTKEMGTPAWSKTFWLSSDSRLYEYQSGLAPFIPKNKGEAIEVKELRWEGFRKNTAVWLKQDETGQWVVIATLYWREGVQF